MQAFKITLEYDGSRFSGWQSQLNARSVQGELQGVARQLMGDGIEIQGAGRTDAGVHALGQVAHIKLKDARKKYRPEQLLRDFNDALPASIAVLDCVDVPARFHARHDATARAYFYQISTRKAALSKRYVWWVKETLEVGKMQECAALIAGRHNFICFRAADPSRPDESTTVVVESAEVAIDDHLIIFRIEASHFLWKMVRRLTGTLVKVGKGDVSVEQFKQLLAGRESLKLDVAAWTAPSSGLFLEAVRY